MKKLTKLTALALALALLLGMTAFAGTPSEVVMIDNFETTDMAIFKAEAGRLPTSYTNTKDGTTQNVIKAQTQYVVGNEAGNLIPGTKYYANLSNAKFVSTNGVIELRSSSGPAAVAEPTNRQLAYVFPEPWTYNTTKALVAQMDWRPEAATITAASGAQTLNNATYPPVGALVEINNISTASLAKGVRGLNGLNTAKGNTSTVTLSGGFNNNLPHQESLMDVPYGTKITLTHVIRPYDGTNINVFDENDVDGCGDNSLNIITMPDRMWSNRNSQYHRPHDADGADAIRKVPTIYGIFYDIPTKYDIGLSNFKLYEVSLDPADFTIVDSEIENVGTGDAVEILFSQPISANVGNDAKVEQMTPIADIITISDAEGNTVPSENYSIGISERIDGTAVKGVLTITPKEDWEKGSTYTVVLPQGLKNIARISMNDYYPDNDEDGKICAAVTFATEADPTYAMELKAYAGLSDAGSELSALEAGTTYFKVTAAYSEGKVVANGTVRLEIKDASGNTVKYVTAKKALGKGTATFGAAFKVEAGYTAKVSIDGGIVGEATID